MSITTIGAGDAAGEDRRKPSFVRRLALAFAAFRQRRAELRELRRAEAALMVLDERMLMDIGISRPEIWAVLEERNRMARAGLR